MIPLIEALEQEKLTCDDRNQNQVCPGKGSAVGWGGYWLERAEGNILGFWNALCWDGGNMGNISVKTKSFPHLKI